MALTSLLAIRAERHANYTRVFNAIVAGRAELSSLYAPLAARIEAESGSARTPIDRGPAPR